MKINKAWHYTAIIFGILILLTAFVLFYSYNVIKTKAQTPPGIKPVIKGLLIRNGAVPESHRAIINTRVISAYWKDLQTSQGAQLSENNPIDQGLAEVKAINQADLTLNMKIKIRIFAGINAPDWAKTIGGDPLTITDPVDGVSGTIGRFWLPEFGQAYQDLQNKLAVKYDEVPEILDVTISRCTTVYAEPFIRDVGISENIRTLLAAGYTAEQDKQCHRQQIEAHNVWTKTRTSLAFNPYQNINSDGTFNNDLSFTNEMMDYCRTVLGERCVLENNSIRYPPIGVEMHNKIKAMGPPIFYQTAKEIRIGDWRQTLEWAIQQGANAVELNNDTNDYLNYPLSELASYDQRLESNPTALPSPTLTPTPTLTPSKSLTPTPQIANTMTISSIFMWYTKVDTLTNQIVTRVIVNDEKTGSVLPSAQVKLTLITPSGVKKYFSNYTDSTGKVFFYYKSAEKGTFTSKVTNVTKNGYLYRPTILQSSLTVK